MKFQFDANQQFQIDAVAAVVDLFDGQPRSTGDLSVANTLDANDLFSGIEQTELGRGNRLQIDAEALRANTRKVQVRNDIEVADEKAALEATELFDGPSDAARSCPHFSVEMETGTGKTYVYLRTIFELNQRYGFQKFIIVVPSVAIREGVLKSIEITKEHFASLYSSVPLEHFVYDAKRVNRLRQFATASTLQILVINIDAFRKNFTGTEDELKSNVIYKEMDRSMGGHAPIEFVQAARPVVIIDEPQSVDATEKSQEAIKALNPLCTLRYSATHREGQVYNLVYRLDPVRAFELKLVKQIVVASAVAEGAANDAFVRVEKVDYEPSIKAKVRVHVQGNDGPKEKSVTLKKGDDLFVRSDERANYRDGYQVTAISAEPGNEFVQFNSGRKVRLGEEIGGPRDDIWRVQIKKTVERHLENELKMQARGIKVLSLFFIDRVANYRVYPENAALEKGKFALAIEEDLAEFAKDARYASIPWLKTAFEKLHDGYFAKDKGGAFKESREGRSTSDDDDAYNLIMKDKERLLDPGEPLRFIFSHSALREGWDNPNVFQICTLAASSSGVKKRQEIGRGLRLPVDQTGVRVVDDTINRLYVMANESYEDFAKRLQTEYEDDCGVTFGKVPVFALAKLTRIEGDTEVAIGKPEAERLKVALVKAKMMDNDGRIGAAFDPKAKDFSLNLPKALSDLEPAVIDLLQSYQIERHIKRDRDQGPNRFKKEVTLTAEFKELWDRIKPKTVYRVEFETADLVGRAAKAISSMEKIEAPKITVTTGSLAVKRGGVDAKAMSVSEEAVRPGAAGLPDILSYLQNETDLTRSTLAQILRQSGRLVEVFANPQRFLDAVGKIINSELHRLLVDGIKYDRVQGAGPESAWEMMKLDGGELVDYLNAILVTKSVYDYVPYDSEIERKFASELNDRDDIKLFMKLPRWFVVETPVGEYNPDWAVVKHDKSTVYLVRETKGTKDFEKLRTMEADKIKCGRRHFEALDVPFSVVTKASEV
ncbi:MAG: DEAD/DEAH box helicase family protein [Hyphomicrobium sp.]